MAEDHPDLVLGGRPVQRAGDRVRRYCGLPWSGGADETWAYRYYDVVETDPHRFGPVDVVTAAALHPGLSRRDLTYFTAHSAELEEFLTLLPTNLTLQDADDETLVGLETAARWPDAPSFSLVTKVLHRKRPALIPLIDRHILDWYRPVTGERSATTGWPKILRWLRDDLALNAALLAEITAELESELGCAPTALRIADIALWMGGQR